MGMNMARRWLQGGHEIIVFNRSQGKVKILEQEGAIGTSSIEKHIQTMESPRILWLMLPADAVDDYIEKVVPLLSKGDLIVDGGNANFKDDVRRAAALAKKGLRYMDAGVSGGIWGLRNGYCTMVGGDAADFERIVPLLRTLAPQDGYLYCGPVGAGHFVKMIHNGIEYGMMQAYGEGFEILKASPYAGSLDLSRVAHLWNQGSVVRSWLLELLESALAKDPGLDGIRGYVEDSGEGRWTVEQAVELGVPATVLAHALFARFRSREGDAFSDRVLAALRNEFGGHAVVKDGERLTGEGAGAGAVRPARADPQMLK
jgi:6-phosphogluconate dehydrogenase